MKTKIMKNKSGFSLVEVIVSVAILTFGITAISALMATNISNSQEAKNEIIAMSLAQEGIELVRNFKDNNPKAAEEIKDFNIAKGDKDFVVKPFMSSLAYTDGSALSTDDASARLYLDAGNNGLYDHAGTYTKKTRFFRKLRLSVSAAGTMTATAYVSWKGDAAPAFPFAIGTDDNPLDRKCTVANKCISITSVMPDTE